jgi:TonB dependent receptor/CarboxypepD_reg-like domain/TonB-dependent Receptor Plug Domain
MKSRSNRLDLLAGTAAILLVASPLAHVVRAQQPAGAPAPATGRISGRVVDAETGQGLTDVGIQVVGTTIGAQSGVEGRFTLPRVPAGTVTIQARRIGYAPKTITGIMLTADGAIEQNVSLSTASVRLTAQVVTASAERGTVNEALDRQRSATGIVNSVTSEQIARSPDSDAAQAVQRVSGVTVQDGKYVFVRGLGERYTTASLNGTRIPSPEPDRKVVPLDLFPSGLIQSITTSKTFTPDQPGDFSGASVDIRTKEFPAKRQFAYSATVGANASATGRQVLDAGGVGGERIAVVGSGRELQRALALAGDMRDPAYTAEFKNPLIAGFRDAWRAGSAAGMPNSSYSASVGGNDPVLGHAVGYLLSATYALTQEVALDQRRALTMPGSDGRPIEVDRFDGQTGRQSAAWGGLLNVGTMVGARSRLSLNGTYNRTADNEARVERGAFTRDLGIAAEIQRLRYVERGVGSAQLSGTHQVGERHTFDWAGTGSVVTRDEPDRSELVYEIGDDGRLSWLSNGEGAVRSYSELTEKSWEGRANYRFNFGAAQQHLVRIGGLVRSTRRDADNRAYGIQAGSIEDSVRLLSPEELFGGRFTAPGSRQFDLVPLAQGGSYDADDRVTAGYAMSEHAVTARLRLIGGARVERSQVRVGALSTLGDPSHADNTYTDVLPSLALSVKLADAQNLRLSGSRTLARPEYRELADVTSRSVFQGELIRGNPNLARTLIDNADVRWEWYPNAGEVVSVGAFAKRFDDPIERVFQPTSASPVIVFVNADAAVNYGVELEARKSLGMVAERLRRLTAFTNLTLMKSEIRLGGSAAASTNANRAMIGQSPYVVNAGLTWATDDGRWSATTLYNRMGERIVAAGELPLPDVRERPRDVLDLSLRFPLLAGFSGKVDARNLLDAEFVQAQGGVVREGYRVGRVVQLGLSWRR